MRAPLRVPLAGMSGMGFWGRDYWSRVFGELIALKPLSRTWAIKEFYSSLFGFVAWNTSNISSGL